MKFVGNSPKLDVPQAAFEGITLGKPQGNEWYSVEEFESMGYVGIYMDEDITAEDARKFWNAVDLIATCKKRKKNGMIIEEVPETVEWDFNSTLESNLLTEENKKAIEEFTKLYLLNNPQWKDKD